MSDEALVTTDWLHEHLDDADLGVVDIRGHVIPASQPPPHYFAHHADYAESHIPGAVFVDWVTDINDPDSPNGTQIARPDDYAALMEGLGIGDETLVVVYDDAESMFAARLWWSLLYYGHDRVAILDGGWQKWLAEGRPVTVEMPQIEVARFTSKPDAKLRSTIEQVAAVVDGREEAVLLDVRSTLEFEGGSSRAKRMGHIPGAVNLPRGEMVTAERTVPSVDDLREKIASVGITDDSTEIIIYCNAGVSASYGLLVLRLAGIDNAAMYDGSWKEWSNDESRPIE